MAEEVVLLPYQPANRVFRKSLSSAPGRGGLDAEIHGTLVRVGYFTRAPWSNEYSGNSTSPEKITNSIY